MATFEMLIIGFILANYPKTRHSLKPPHRARTISIDIYDYECITHAVQQSKV